MNGTYKARHDALQLLLKTFRRAAIQGPVADKAQPNVIRQMSSRGKKVEIYLGGEEPAKTWYVGTATPSHTGTYMVLETPEGRGEKPYVVHMEGFTGFLSTRFFTSEREWRHTASSIIQAFPCGCRGAHSGDRWGVLCAPCRETGKLVLADLEGNPSIPRHNRSSGPFFEVQKGAPRNVPFSSFTGC